MSKTIPSLVAVLTTKWPEDLTDEELQIIEENLDAIQKEIFILFCHKIQAIEKEIDRRSQKREFEKLSTSELQIKISRVSCQRAKLIIEDINDELPDSFFEFSRYDENSIISEILKERRARKKF
jgi:GTPase Era involved in 16S rRNA processing